MANNLPPVTIDTIADANWQMSNKDLGQVAIGVDDILMCIHNILFTIKGEVPFFPFFGSLLYQALDLPVNKIIPFVTAEVIDAISQWEPRVTIQSVVPSFNSDFSNIEFTINMKVISTSGFLGYTFKLDNSKGNGRAFSDAFSTPDFG